MKRVLILIKSKEKINFVNTASDSLKKYLARDDYQVDRDYLGYVNFVFDSAGKKWDGFIRDKALESYDLIYLQTAGSMKDQATLLANYCTYKKIKIIEGNFVVTGSNSKLIQVMKCFQNSLPIPKTAFLGDWEKPNTNLDYPLVAKDLLGKGGAGVSMINNKKELTHLSKNKGSAEYLLQEFIPNKFDWRILVIGDTAIYGCKRVRQENESFRNNVKLGAKEVLGEPSQEVKNIALKAAKVMNLPIAGVDIIENNGKAYIIEINRSPSLPVSYETFKAIPALGEMIKKCLK